MIYAMHTYTINSPWGFRVVVAKSKEEAISILVNAHIKMLRPDTIQRGSYYVPNKNILECEKNLDNNYIKNIWNRILSNKQAVKSKHVRVIKEIECKCGKKFKGHKSNALWCGSCKLNAKTKRLHLYLEAKKKLSTLKVS